MLPENIQRFLDDQVAEASVDYSDLKATYINGTLKRSPQVSQTEGLMSISTGIMRGLGVDVTVIRTVDHVIPPGLETDMTEHGYDRDDFPQIYAESIEPADIIILATPIWLGDQSSMTRLMIERMYAYSGELNDRGQWSYYGKVGGALITGNEDGGKHCSAMMLYSLQHIGLVIPPQADTYWNGEAGPGPSYLDPENGGTHNAWTTRNTAFMTWNILHMTRMVKDAGGIPAFGNLSSQWDLSMPDCPNPEYR
ncbi:MAG: flavodoxin family protein [Actinobacteria bacterium]|nr:flavodoxin family protein [Actinomycetota bacterium]